MDITRVEFTLGAATLGQLPRDGRREIAFLGRSNVGKSSLINRLCGRRSLARKSSQPGKTRQLNYFLVNDRFYLVDLPGYGYARVPEQVRAAWGTLIEQYLRTRETLALAVQVLDARHGPTDLDRMMAGWLDTYGIPFLAVLTKSDRIPRGRLAPCLEGAREALGARSSCRGVLVVSSVTGEGRPAMLSIIARALA
ncbi:MAG: ribosome biogenesis GTP-binding protein YihA/YsxC [Bacteroidota bacterium]